MRALMLLVVISLIAVALDGCGGSSTGTTSPVVPPNTHFDGIYGAQADQGETDDPLVDATTYASGTTYSIGKMVVSAGQYYISESDDNTGNALSDKSKWWGPAAGFLYVDCRGQ